MVFQYKGCVKPCFPFAELNLSEGKKGGEGLAFTKDSYSMLDTAFSIVLQICSSTGMSIANKLAITALPLACTLVGIQELFTLLYILPRFFMPPTVDENGNTVKSVELGEWVDTIWYFPACVAQSASLFTSMFAYSRNTLATLVVFKNLAPLIAMGAELMQAKPIQVNKLTVTALVMAVVGCYLFGHDSLDHLDLTANGLLLVMLNLLVITFVHVYLRWVMKKELIGKDGTTRQLKINNVGMMFYQSLVGGVLPAVVISTLVFDEYKEYATMFSAVNWSGAIYIGASCVGGVCISYAGFRLQRRVSATSFFMVGSTSKIAVLGFGAFVLKDQYTLVSFIGCVIAMVSALVYTKGSMAIEEAKKAKEAAASAGCTGKPVMESEA